SRSGPSTRPVRRNGSAESTLMKNTAYGPRRRSAGPTGESPWRGTGGARPSEDGRGFLVGGDLLPGDAQLEKHLLGVLAVLGCASQVGWRLVELDGVGNQVQRVTVADVDLWEIPVGCHLGVVVELSRRLHRRPYACEGG